MHSFKFERSILEFEGDCMAYFSDCMVGVEQNVSNRKHFSLDEMFGAKNILMIWIRAIAASDRTLDNKLVNCALVCEVLISRSGPNLPGN